MGKGFCLFLSHMFFFISSAPEVINLLIFAGFYEISLFYYLVCKISSRLRREWITRVFMRYG